MKIFTVVSAIGVLGCVAGMITSVQRDRPRSTLGTGLPYKISIPQSAVGSMQRGGAYDLAFHKGEAWNLGVIADRPWQPSDRLLDASTPFSRQPTYGPSLGRYQPPARSVRGGMVRVARSKMMSGCS